MSMYEDYSRVELIGVIRKKDRDIEELKEEIRRLDLDLSSAKFKIEHELEPRIAREKRAYDNWVTNSER